MTPRSRLGPRWAPDVRGEEALDANHIRLWSSNARDMLLRAEVHCGPNIGRGLGERMLWDLAETLAEVHGREIAAEALLRTADAVCRGIPLGTVVEFSPAAAVVVSAPVVVVEEAIPLPVAPPRPKLFRRPSVAELIGFALFAVLLWMAVHR